MSTQAIAIDAASRQRYLLVLLFAGFVLTGVEITVVGPMLPVFITRWSLSDSQAGVLSAVQFGGSLAGVWLSSLITHYLGTRTSLVLGFILIAAGLATVNAPTLTLAYFALAALGVGYGLVVPPTNLTVAEIGGARSASLVSLVNFAWGAGAVSCSPLVLLALKSHLLPQLLFSFAALGALLAFLFLFSTFPESKHAAPASSSSNVVAARVGLLTTIVLAALFFSMLASSPASASGPPPSRSVSAQAQSAFPLSHPCFFTAVSLPVAAWPRSFFRASANTAS